MAQPDSRANLALLSAAPDKSTAADALVLLVDVDNTLLDNDHFLVDLRERLKQSFGAAQEQRFWQIFNARRQEIGLADYLGTLQLFRDGVDDLQQLLQMSDFLLDYPFSSRVFPEARAALTHLGDCGKTVLLSDGDMVFQPRKIRRSGLWDAVSGRVLIYVHKEKVLDDVQQRYPAAHYVVVDDKPNLLAAMKRVLKAKLTTIFVRQGQYALAPDAGSHEPSPDRVIERIGDLINLTSSDFQVPT
jgi:FMN phosphatase YigB (HAD superfamily)